MASPDAGYRTFPPRTAKLDETPSFPACRLNSNVSELSLPLFYSTRMANRFGSLVDVHSVESAQPELRHPPRTAPQPPHRGHDARTLPAAGTPIPGRVRPPASGTHSGLSRDTEFFTADDGLGSIDAEQRHRIRGALQRAYFRDVVPESDAGSLVQPRQRPAPAPALGGERPYTSLGDLSRIGRAPSPMRRVLSASQRDDSWRDDESVLRLRNELEQQRRLEKERLREGLWLYDSLDKARRRQLAHERERCLLDQRTTEPTPPQPRRVNSRGSGKNLKAGTPLEVDRTSEFSFAPARTATSSRQRATHGRVPRSATRSELQAEIRDLLASEKKREVLQEMVKQQLADSRLRDLEDLDAAMLHSNNRPPGRSVIAPYREPDGVVYDCGESGEFWKRVFCCA